MSVPTTPQIDVRIAARADGADRPGERDAAPQARRLQSELAMTLARHTIADRLGIGQGEVRIAHLGSGAPIIRSPTDPVLSVSMAHHPGLAGCAVTDGLPVGIDIERIRGVRCLERLLAAHLSARERRWVERSGCPHEAFLRLWTRKEAWLKAVHRGISIPLGELDVLDDAIDATSLAVVHDLPPRGTVRTWTMPGGWLVSVAEGSRAWRPIRTRVHVVH